MTQTCLAAPGKCLTSSWIHIFHICLQSIYNLVKLNVFSVAIPEVSSIFFPVKGFLEGQVFLIQIESLRI